MSTHISVCICTYRRPRFLHRLLEELGKQVTDGLFTYSIVVVDNDSGRSGAKTVSRFQHNSAIQIQYLVEPTRNIALDRKGSHLCMVQRSGCLRNSARDSLPA